MEYCCHIWAGASACLLSLLDRVQKRIINPFGKGLGTTLQPLSHRRSVTDISMVNVPPVYLTLFLLSGYLSARPGFLLVLILILWLCRDVEQRATPVAFSLVLHLFWTPCLVHVSLHPMIFHLLRGMSISTFSSTEFLHVYVFSLNLEWLLALLRATCINKSI